MKKKILTIGLAMLTGISFTQEVPTLQKCYTHEYIQYKEKENPGYKEQVDMAFDYAKNNNLKSNDVYTVPVVVHIVYGENNPEQNVPDSVIHNQIKTLNEDFMRRNADTVNLREEFEIVAGKPNIQFQLEGITRTETNVSTFLEDPADLLMSGNMSQLERVKKTAEGGIDPWDQQHYMNIWVCNMAIDFMGSEMPFLLGYATPPGGLPNWPLGSTNGMDDGVVIQYSAFGSNNPVEIEQAVIKGRTATHEVGHYLGLRHIWADSQDCNEDDGVDDTPAAKEESEGCPNQNSCVDDIYGMDLPDMVENFMDYSDEDCQNSFTEGQVAIMRGVLENQREDLVLDEEDVTVAVKQEKMIANMYPNPASNVINIVVKNNPIQSVEILNMNGQIVLTSEEVQATKHSVNVETLEQGVYIVKILSTKGNSTVKKFVKQ